MVILCLTLLYSVGIQIVFYTGILSVFQMFIYVYLCIKKIRSKQFIDLYLHSTFDLQDPYMNISLYMYLATKAPSESQPTWRHMSTTCKQSARVLHTDKEGSPPCVRYMSEHVTSRVARTRPTRRPQQGRGRFVPWTQNRWSEYLVGSRCNRDVGTGIFVNLF